MYKFFLILSIFFLLFLSASTKVYADECTVLTGQAKVDCYDRKTKEAQAKERSLSSEIDKINANISLTQAQIEDTSDRLDRLGNDISSVSGKIERIEGSLAQVSTVLANRIAATYIAGREDPVFYLLSSTNFAEMLRRLDYFRIVQKHDKNLMIQMATTRKNYADQKNLLEDKKNQVEALSKQLKIYKANLVVQNEEKSSLLKVTQNDEKRYQQLLSSARAELNAVNTAKYSGQKNVRRGEVIGLMGSTGFSTGPHLHFGVYNLSEDQASNWVYASGTQNPLNFLKNRSMSVEQGACYDKLGTVSVGGGDWDWPMGDPRITQCFGKTPFSFVYANGVHDGLDMYATGDITVRAVDDGHAYFYRGTSSLGNNVRVFHSNGKMTLYLHLQ